MILPHQEIYRLCCQNGETEDGKAIKPLIEGYKKENIRTASYDLRLGKQFYLPELNDSEFKKYQYQWQDKFIHNLGLERKHNKSINIPQNGFVLVISYEKVNIPNNLVGHLSLKLFLGFLIRRLYFTHRQLNGG